MKEKINILLVEDEPGDAFLIEEMLTDHQEVAFQISKAGTLLHAREELKSKVFDVVLLDLGLPDSFGLDSLNEILKMNSVIPILIITGSNDEETGRKSIGLGAQGYISKSKLDSAYLVQTILFSIERNQHVQKIRKNEKELEEKNRLLEQANASKDRLFSIISHDLKGPFGPLLGFLAYLDDNYDALSDAKKKDYISMLRTSADSIYLLLENLLLWSVSQSDRLSFNPEKLLLLDQIKEVVSNFNQNLITKNIRIQIEVDQEISVLADQDMIHTILRNLISNAIKFSHRNSQIIVGGRIDPSGEAIVFVKDSGVGIKQEDLPKIFNNEGGFTTKGTNDEKGTGLGMMICKEFVAKHGGTIWVESEVGKGSVFQFSIPSPD